MATVASKTFILAPTTDKYLTLAGEEYLRKLAIGNNWTSLRVGMMFAMTPDGTNDISQPALQLGICSADPTTFANTAGFSAASTRNYIGFDFFCHSNGSVQDAQYNANSGLPYFSIKSTLLANFRRRVGTTNTNTTVANDLAAGIPTNTGSLQRRKILYVDFTKGSPNYTLRPWNANTNGTNGSLANGVNRDYSLAHFLSGFETATPVCDGVTFRSWDGNINTTLACSEVAGDFDTVSIWWNRMSFPIEVYALAARRLA